MERLIGVAGPFPIGPIKNDSPGSPQSSQLCTHNCSEHSLIRVCPGFFCLLLSAIGYQNSSPFPSLHKLPYPARLSHRASHRKGCSLVTISPSVNTSRRGITKRCLTCHLMELFQLKLMRWDSFNTTKSCIAKLCLRKSTTKISPHG